MDDEIDEAVWNDDEEMEEDDMDHSDDLKPEPSDDVIMHSSQGEEGSKDSICSDDSKMDKDNDFGDKDFEKAQIKNLREDELTIEKIEDIDSVFEEYDKTSEKELTYDHCIVNKEELDNMENIDEMREEENNSRVDAFSNALHDVSNEFLIYKNEINKAEKIHENVEIKKIRSESPVTEEDNTSVDCDKISKETSSQEQMTEKSLATALNDRPVDEPELLVVGEKKSDVDYNKLSNDESNSLENLLGISEMEATFSADVDSGIVISENKTLVEDDKIINKIITDVKIETKLSPERVYNIDSNQNEQEIFETEQEVSNDKRKVFADYDKIVDESIAQERKKEIGISLTKIDDFKGIESSSLFEEKTFAEYDEIINAIITREKSELKGTSIITSNDMKPIVEENKILADYDEIINATITKGKLPKKKVFSVNIGDEVEGSKPESLVKEHNTYDNYDKIINETIKKKMSEIEMSSTIGGDHYQSNNYRYENDESRLDEKLLFGSRTFDKDLFTNDETKENKDDSNDLHSEGMKTLKLSHTKNHTEDFRGLDVQEGELDFEEEVHVEQNNSMSDLIIGELEQKERLNTDIDDKTQDNEKGDDSKDDNDEGEVEDDEDLEEGELKDTNGMKPLVRPICRFYNKGNCTWGSSCRFIHPGFNDKGNYSMFADDKYGPGTHGPHPLQDSNHPGFAGPWLPETGSDGLPHPPPPEPIIESAWERGLRQAKELMKKANQRKESKPNYEEKRASITLEDQDIDKENEYQCRLGKTDSYFNYGYDDPRDYLEREPPYWQSGRYENIKFEVRWNRQPGFPPFRNREREKEPRPRPRETTPPLERRREDRERWRHDRYTETTTSSSGNNKVRTRADEWRDPWRRSVSPKRHHSASPRRRSRSRGNDHSRRSYSSGSSASYSSSGSSRSRSSSYSSYSGSSSGSSYYSSNRSYSHSRSRSRSRTPLRNKRNIPAPTLPLTKKRPPRPPTVRQPSTRPPSSRLPSSRAISSRPLSSRPPPSNEPRSQITQVKSKNRIQSPERKKNILPPQTTVPAPVRRRPTENKPIRKTERRSEKRSRSREWSRSKSYSSHSGSSSSRSRSLSVSSVSSNHSSSTSASADSQHMYARMGSPANSKSRSPPPPPPPPPPPAPPLPGRKEEKPKPDKKRKPPITNLEGKFPIPILDTKIIDSKLKSSMNAPVANRAKDPLKHSGHKPIKLTLLSKPSEKPLATNVFKKDVLDISVKNLATASPKPTFVDKVDRKILKAAMSSLKTEMRPPKSPSPSRSPINNSKNVSDRKRPTSSPPLMAPPAKISLPPIVPSKSITSKKTTSSRREELLKQLKAVEDAIARKRSKLS